MIPSFLFFFFLSERIWRFQFFDMGPVSSCMIVCFLHKKTFEFSSLNLLLEVEFVD